MPLLISASNTWGLFLLVCNPTSIWSNARESQSPRTYTIQVLMMGYGIVDVPRTLWRSYNRSQAMEALEVCLSLCVVQAASNPHAMIMIGASRQAK
jgi:hypothetical protein